MSKMNILVDLKGYDGNNANTCKTKFGRNAQYIGIDITDETVQEVTVAAGNSETLFSVAPAEAKKFIYLEATAECDITVNGIAESSIKPVVIADSVKSGVYLKSSDIESVVVTNNGASDLKVYYITSK
jgi:hypothetical protein